MQKVFVSAVVPGRMSLVALALMPLLLLLAMVPVSEAAPLETLHPGPLTLKGDHKPPDLWSATPDSSLASTELAAEQRLTPVSQTTSISAVPPAIMLPQRITKPTRKHLRRDPATSHPELRDKSHALFGDLGRITKTFPSATALGVEEKTTSSASGFIRARKTGEQVTGRPSMHDQAGTENSSLDKQTKTSTATTERVQPGQEGVGAGKRERERVGVLVGMGAGIPEPEADRMEKLMKMLSALEEFYRAFNSTLSSRITLITRGNGRNSGKKGKTATAEGAVKTTAAPSTDSSGTAARSSTAEVDPQSLSGKAFKKSLPAPAKKGNKRVCFWKYCSQN